MRFLLRWQRVAPDARAEGPEGLGAVLELLDGYEVPAGAWEADVLPARLGEYDPLWLDGLCLSGEIAWGRLSPSAPTYARSTTPPATADPRRSPPRDTGRRATTGRTRRAGPEARRLPRHPRALRSHRAARAPRRALPVPRPGRPVRRAATATGTA